MAYFGYAPGHSRTSARPTLCDFCTSLSTAFTTTRSWETEGCVRRRRRRRYSQVTVDIFALHNACEGHSKGNPGIAEHLRSSLHHLQCPTKWSRTSPDATRIRLDGLETVQALSAGCVAALPPSALYALNNRKSPFPDLVKMLPLDNIQKRYLRN